MTPWTVLPLAFLTGVLFNLNPYLRKRHVAMDTRAKQPWRMALLVAIRIGLEPVGALAGALGTAMRVPFG